MAYRTKNNKTNRKDVAYIHAHGQVTVTAQPADSVSQVTHSQ